MTEWGLGYLPSLGKVMQFTPEPLATGLRSTWDMAGVIDKWCMCKHASELEDLLREKM